jgi:hypothetical protein
VGSGSDQVWQKGGGSQISGQKGGVLLLDPTDFWHFSAFFALIKVRLSLMKRGWDPLILI